MIVLRTLLPWLMALAFLVTGAAAQEMEDRAEFGSGETRLLLRSTTDIAILRPVIQLFADRNPDLTIVYEQWGSNDLFALSRAGCREESEPADAVFSSAVQHMVWLVNAACARQVQSPLASALPPARRWRNELWGITTEPAVIVYNKAAISGAEVPRTRFALLDAMRTRPEFFRGRIATYDIGASGLGFLFAYADSLEATSFGSLLEGFARIEAVATCCSAEIIRGVAEGRYLMAYNVLGSYVLGDQSAEIGFILPEDYTLLLSRAYMIPRQARQPEAAERLLDFLLSTPVQAQLADAGLVSPIDDAENGLAPSARRFIPLSPALLVAMDRNRRAALFAIWDDAFRRATGP
ncbi:iron ABC transporter [Mameliella alba]|uniref:Extracellular solute-binding protein family 1 n=1 Tax=Mameliella alba TaxID=561184 RepID=A0A0B3RXD8_9RHOB|nr:ABC transporter substrate-binding protein [Mameliella alba]KHQ51383.1 Extracellular solute-binding protein family 1 [Mameliella alba]BBU55140.1 iron ABC transporter [Mameliella alba]